MVLNNYTFDNGFRVIHEKPLNKLPITSIQIVCDIGSIYETDNNRGASHMIEHMVFKGTEHIKDRKYFFSVFDKYGAYINATTDKRITNYTIKCEDSHTLTCLKLISDMLLYSTFDKNEYVKEKEVVVEENIKDVDDVELTLFDHIEKIMFDGTPYAFPIDSVDYHTNNKKLEHDEVFDLYKKMYKPNRMILSIVSSISFENILKMVKKTFFNTHLNNSIQSYPLFNKITNSQLKLEKEDDIIFDFVTNNNIEPVHISICFKTCNYFSDDKFALNFLQSILSGSMLARLFMILREDNGLTYTSDIDTDYNELMGTFVIYAESDKSKILKHGNKKGVIPLIIDMLNDLIKNGVTEEEVKNTIGYLKGNYLLNNESNEDCALHNGIELLLKPPEEIISYYDIFDKKFKHMTKKMIDNVIKKYFKKSLMTVCIISNKNINKKQIIKEVGFLLREP